jgi:hypothetical protein
MDAPIRPWKRNAACACGSGVKFKHCCGALSPSMSRTFQPVTFPPEAMSLLAEHERRLGHARPIVSLDSNGYKLVAVGSTLHWSRTWKTFPDFLGDYIKKALGPSWGTAEIKKPFEERHPILQWYEHVCLLQNTTIQQPGEVAEAEMTGPVFAYLHLAYALYLLRDNSLLEDRLLARLRNCDQFQGALYETSIAAAFVRAGFGITLENETDSTESHCEFTVSHLSTGSKFSVEAKSRHRPGVLGQKGAR